jgi:hypothetical protein
MAFRVESKKELLKSLDETRRLILEREKLLKDRVNFAVKIRDYTAEAIYVLTSEILELEKLFIIYMVTQMQNKKDQIGYIPSFVGSLPHLDREKIIFIVLAS